MSGPLGSGQTISWSHELDTSKLTQGWFCLCGLQCSSKGKLNTHTNSFNQVRNFSCKLCAQRFPSVNYLFRHLERSHQIIHRGWVGCGDCGAVFKTRLEQARHRAAFHDEFDRYSGKKLGEEDQNQKRDKDCVDATSSSPSSSTASCTSPKHLRVADSSTASPFACSCGKVFATKEYLSRHQRYKLKMFKCPLCNKNFGQWYNLKNHLASKHIGEYQQECFECGKCGQVFPNIDHVVAHYQAMHGHLHLLSLHPGL